MRKKLRRCSIEIRSRAVHALHNGLVQPAGEGLLGQIVLVLADAYGFGIYLYKLRRGSRSLLAMDTADLSSTAISGNSFLAASCADQTDAPASETIA